MLTMLHAENGEIIEVMQKQLLAQNKTAPKYHAVSRPPVVEEEATIRSTMLAKAAETRSLSYMSPAGRLWRLSAPPRSRVLPPSVKHARTI